MKKRVTDKTLRQFFWETQDLPNENKAAYLLGDLSRLGVSRCKKVFLGKKWVYFEFDIYRTVKHKISLMIDLPIDFGMKDIENSIMTIWNEGGVVVSDATLLFRHWEKNIMPHYNYDHARYAALRFLEAIRKKLLDGGKNK